jgi:ketohexokinase
MAKILAVGIATLDIINTVERYPLLDGETRALSQHKTRGGNATNLAS